MPMSRRVPGIEDSVRALEQLARKRERPSHFLARGILLGIGAELREGRPTEPLLERVRAAVQPIAAEWREAVGLELSMAIAEFAGSVNPRYLGLPDYDHGYTGRVRALVEDRLNAARALDVTPAARECQILDIADGVWADHNASRGEKGREEPPGRG
jgi:hypothetical protein